MKTRIIISAVAVALPLFAGAYKVWAQDSYTATPVTVSTEKVRKDGKVFLSHVVLERQTLFSIAKAYGVTVEEILGANPSLSETGLQKNSIILIPYKEQAPAKTGTVVETPAAPGPDAGYVEHVVKWFEDIDQIAENYGVSVRAIMDLNGLTSKKVTKRQVLRIPVRKAEETKPVEGSEGVSTGVPSSSVAPAVPEVDPDNFPAADTLAAAASDSSAVAAAAAPSKWEMGPYAPKNHVRMALALPFRAESTPGESNFDFYSGVLMALNDLRRSGITVTLDVYDLAAGLPSKEQLTSCDFVLGPVSMRDLDFVLRRTEGKVEVISPLDQRVATLANSYDGFIQVPCKSENQYQELGKWIAGDFAADSTGRVILVSEKNAASTVALVGLRSALSANEVNYELLRYSLDEGRQMVNVLSAMMSPTGVNRFVVASENEAFVGDVLRNMGVMQSQGFQVALYAPSKVRNFDTVDGNGFHETELHAAAQYYVDYQRSDVDAFLRTYRALYRCEPTQYAFHGYDCAMYFVNLVATYGESWKAAMLSVPGSGLQTDFRFTLSKGSDEDGVEHYNPVNTALRKIIFRKDFSVEVVK